MQPSYKSDVMFSRKTVLFLSTFTKTDGAKRGVPHIITCVQKLLVVCLKASVLESLLYWNIFYNSIRKVRIPQRTTLKGFDDDTAIIIKVKTVRELQLKMELAVRSSKNLLRLTTMQTEVLILYGWQKMKEMQVEVKSISQNTSE